MWGWLMGTPCDMRILKHPIKTLRYLTAFGIGYVLGAQAGRERYEQILQAISQAKGGPRVQEAADRAEDLARDAATTVAESTTSTPTATGGDRVHPLLADEHVQAEDEVVYSTGPDIESTVDELLPDADAERV